VLTKKQMKQADASERTKVRDLRPGDYVVARLRKKGKRVKRHDILYRIDSIPALSPDIQRMQVHVQYPDGAIGTRVWPNGDHLVSTLGFGE
jgi:hypothetical protein